MYKSRMTATVVCVGYDSGIVACFDVDGNTLFEKKLAQVPVQVHMCLYIYMYIYICTYLYIYLYIFIFMFVII
jgi:hypothetical protein